MCCGPKIHLGFTLGILTICIALSILGICLRQWVHFEVDIGSWDESYDGGLFTVSEWPAGGSIEIDHYGWDCIAVDPCDVDDDSTNCKTFEPLMDAGRLYL